MVPFLADKENNVGLITVALQQQTIHVYKTAAEAKPWIAEGLYEYLKPTLKVAQLHCT